MKVPIRKLPNLPLRDYDDIRADIRSGDLLFCSGGYVFSRMIQKATGSIWSHVGIVWRLDQIDRVMLMESVESHGVRLIPLSQYIGDYCASGRGYKGDLLIGRHTEFDAGRHMNPMAAFAVDLLSYPYDGDEKLRIAARIGMSAAGLAKGEAALKRDREFICSEFVWECLAAVGIRVQEDHKGFIAPADFARDPKVRAMFRLRTKP